MLLFLSLIISFFDILIASVPIRGIVEGAWLKPVSGKTCAFLETEESTQKPIAFIKDIPLPKIAIESRTLRETYYYWKTIFSCE